MRSVLDLFLADKHTYRMQTKMPRFQLAHLGSVFKDLSMEFIHRGTRKKRNVLRLFLLQSAQLLFDSNFTKLFRVCWFCAARSAPGFSRLDISVVLQQYFKECWILLFAGFMEAEGIRVEGIVAVLGCRIVAGDVQQ